jgi:hypothetical protein
MSELFKRKTLKLDKVGEMDGQNENDLESCGLKPVEESTLIQRNNEFFDSLNIKASEGFGENPVCATVKLMESLLSPREISFLLAKQILTAKSPEESAENPKEELEENKKTKE